MSTYNNYENHVGDKHLDYFLTNLGEVTETFSQCMAYHGDENTLLSSNDSNCSCSQKMKKSYQFHSVVRKKAASIQQETMTSYGKRLQMKYL